MKYRTAAIASLAAFSALSLFAVVKIKSGNEEEPNYATSTVKVEIHGIELDIPANYIYMNTMEKYKKLRPIPEERKKLGAVTIEALLPDLTPYKKEDDAIWRQRGFGRRINITIARPYGGENWFETALESAPRFASKQFSIEKGNNNVVQVFVGSNFTDYYSRTPRNILTTCDNPSSAPYKGCRTKSITDNGLTTEYSYSESYSEDFIEIDNRVHHLISSFSINN